ncbi:urease accessory protein UreE [Klebsiella aerogenes]|nr:urease accessory protein UreE [Klebsiella aerogenes]
MLYLTQRLETPAAATASVTLPIDVRVKSRVKVTLNDGREAGLLLPAACCCAAAMCSATKKAPSLCR